MLPNLEFALYRANPSFATVRALRVSICHGMLAQDELWRIVYEKVGLTCFGRLVPVGFGIVTEV